MKTIIELANDLADLRVMAARGQCVTSDEVADAYKALEKEIAGAVARGWCHPNNSHKVMDTDLALAIIDEVKKLQAQEAAPDLNDLLVGKLVSMDVSTGEHDAYHRVFGTVCEVMLQSCGAAEDTILAIEDSRNFQAAEPAKDTQIVRPLVEANNDEVICPNCCNQFRAVPVNVQQLMLDAGFEPPFKKAPAVEPVGYTDKHGHTYAIKWSGALPPNLTLYTSPPDHTKAMRLALEHFHKLACLGNGDQYGNSTGNVIAQAAIAALEGCLK